MGNDLDLPLITPPSPARIWAMDFLEKVSFNRVPTTNTEWKALTGDGQKVRALGKKAVLPNTTADDKARNREIFGLLQGFAQWWDKEGFSANAATVDEGSLTMTNNMVSTNVAGDQFTVSLDFGAQRTITGYLTKQGKSRG